MHKMQVAGAEMLVKQIIERLRGEIEPTVLCLDGLGELGQQLLDEGVPVVPLGRKPGVDLKVAQRLSHEVKTRRVQVLHAHQYTPFFYSALARVRHRAKARVLFTEHGRHYPDVVSWKRRWANRLVLRRYADTTTACCDFSTRALQALEGFPDATTLRNGVDLSLLPARSSDREQAGLRARLGLDPDRPYAACIARFHPVKDHATLIRSWKTVHETVPTARLLLVGDGEGRSKAEDQAKQLGISDSVQFLGIRSDIAEILRAVDVFTLASVSEAASLTLLEAMASGCASVVTDVGGNPEHVDEGVEGHLVPRGDSERLAQRLGQLLQDLPACHAMGHRARERVERDFDLESAVDAYAAHYRALASPATVTSPSKPDGQPARDQPCLSK